jgi:endonuclease/exonuclease/phosphatase (EEP) superfamily protein YafD
MTTKIIKWLQEKSFLTKLTEIISLLATALVIAMSIGIWLFPQNFIFALVRSLTPQIALGAWVLLVVHLFRYRLKLFLTAYGALMLLIPTFLSLLFPDNMAKIQKGKPRIVLAQFNVLKFNHEHESVIQSIKASEADIVSLQEAEGSWARDIHQNIAKDYPYSFSYPSENCCFDIALCSKIPLKNAQLNWYSYRLYFSFTRMCGFL